MSLREVIEEQKEFEVACGNEVGETYEVATRQGNIIVEEANELVVAIQDLLWTLRNEPGTFAGDKRAKLLSEVVAEGVDLVYVVASMYNALGLQDEAQRMWLAIHEANMKKVDPVTGQVVRREEDGKILKPKGWQPVDKVKVFKGE